MSSQSTSTGGVFAFFYVVIMAFSVVWIGQLQNNFSEPMMLMIVSLAAIVIYNLLSLRHIRKAYVAIAASPLYWLGMSLFFALTWCFIFFSTIHASPRSTITVFYLTLAMLGCVFDKKYIFVLISCIFIIASFYLFPEFTAVTRLASLASGVCCYIYMRCSELFAVKNELEAHQVLSVRFYILFIMSIVLMYFQFRHAVPAISGSMLFVYFALLLLIFFNLMPNFCAQKGILMLGTKKFSQFIIWTPVFTFVLQGLFNHEWNLQALGLCLAASLLLVLIYRNK